MHKLAALISIALLGFMVACGGSSSNGGGPPPPTQVTLNMTSASSLINQGTQFTANAPVNWAVTEKNGGSITNQGLYTAPPNTGTFHVVATSTADATKSATASVAVAAEFLSLQKNLAGTSMPFSVSPVLTKLAADGTFTSTVLKDAQTGNPVDSNAFDIFISPDGLKAVFTSLSFGTYDGDPTYFYDIALATSSTPIGSSSTADVTLTPLTHNSTNTNDYLMDMLPQLSPDGKTIVYTHIGPDPVTGMRMSATWKMDIDGSGAQPVFHDANSWSFMPTFSPNGKMIAVEVSHMMGNAYFDGIATMNADGSNFTQVTGADAETPPCWGYDQMPAFTSDGKQIVFTRECWPDEGGITNTLYAINVDGTGLTQIHGGVGVISCQPRTFANNSIAFESNVNAIGTDSFDMYSIMPDGSNLKQITNNTVYDGFSVWWMNYSEVTAAARVYRSHSPAQQRLAHRKMEHQHKVR